MSEFHFRVRAKNAGGEGSTRRPVGARMRYGLWGSLSMVAGGLVLVRVGSDLRLFQGALTLWLP